MRYPYSPPSSVGSNDSDSRLCIDFLLNEQSPKNVFPKEEYTDEDSSNEEFLSEGNPNARISRSPPREKYTEEKMFFVWYHRVDLDMPWDKVTNAYNCFFPEDRNKGGLQCRFYRALNQYNVKKIREQARHGRITGGEIEKFGVLDCTNRRFTWMLPHHLADIGIPILRASPRKPRGQKQEKTIGNIGDQPC
ncbi:hypothetical protein PV08_05235 [Exophiala spinifera]|uniref:Uncharacterized protein n=1 Tax=Exophiala spinifera TaxID=91928 RepID=A0A0D2B952_9EURO|nr:uncharacterized protein PV08_05235 [Exophiala spinifera]KIW15190.1 hypothetical protein PV08_05235 [Exophiala spinifera]